jgi:serine/threonine-protein kinase
MFPDRPGSFAAMPSLQPGTLLGRYQLLCVVAQGGMGAVWAARLRADHGFERKVAIKTILPQHAQDRRFREMFLDEARLASRIIHGNVVQVLDLAEQDGVVFQAMEWVEGDSLRVLASLIEDQDESVPWPIALRIVLEVAKGLHAAHELRDDQGQLLHVVHRDVSPQNILVGLDGSVRISDFGIAKARDRLTPETSQGHIKGKLRYMAPEQALGKELDRRADIWSLGAVLHELLTGRPLFDAPNEAALLYEVVSSPPTLLFEEPIHPRLLALLRRAVSRSPEGRQPTAQAFAEDLRRAARDAQLEASREDLAKFFQQHLAGRCDARRGVIDKTVKTSITLASSEIDVVAKDDVAIDQELPDFSDGFGRRLRRWRAWIGGAVVLGTLALGIGWFLLGPRERLTADRFVSIQPMSVPVLPTAAPSSAFSEPAVVSPVQSASSARAPSTTRPPRKRPPPSGTRPPFDEIDDGF